LLKNRINILSEIRKVSDLKDILFDKSFLKNTPNFIVYKVTRGISHKNGLRYDETVILPKLLGKEFPKTKGHEHPKKCIELIKVLKGKAIFLLQKDEKDIIKDIYFIKAKAGQCLISPAEYSHTTINALNKELKIGTWIDNCYPSDYSNIKKFKGFGYYHTILGWQKNKNYKKVPKLKEKKPLKLFPKNLKFLKNCCS